MSTSQLSRIALVLAIAALALGLVVAAVTFLGMLSSALVIMIASVLLAYALAPIVEFFRRRTPLPVAVTLAYLMLLGVVVVFFFLLVPPIVAQSKSFADAFPTLANKLLLALQTRGPLASLPPSISGYVDALPTQIANWLTSQGPALVQRGVDAALSAASVVLSLLIVPILAAYLAFDAGDLKRAVVGFVPAERRPVAFALLADLNAVLGGFIRGQLLDGAIVGFLVWLMLTLNHVPFALLIGVAAGALNLVPYLGSVVGFVPSVLLALSYNGWQSALLVAALFAVIQQVDGNLIVPRIMKANVSLSPVILIVSILTFTALFGIIGTVIAVPVAAMLRVVKLYLAPAPALEDAARDELLGEPLRRFRT